MMNFLRKNVKTFLWAIAVAFILGIFLWNFSARRLTIDCVAKVNGTKIPYSYFLDTLNRRIRNWYDANPEKELSEEELKQIKSEVLNSLIQEELINQEAKKHGISVAQDELITIIRSLPQFQRDGKFASDLYLYVLRNYYRTEPAVYESQIKKTITHQKMTNLILSTVKVTSAEVKNEISRRNLNISEDEFRKNLLQEKKIMFYRQWLMSLYQRAKIINNLEKIEKGLVPTG